MYRETLWEVNMEYMPSQGHEGIVSETHFALWARGGADTQEKLWALSIRPKIPEIPGWG